MPANSANSALATLDTLKLLLASVALIVCATGQALVFKSVAYPLGPYPYFILITVSSAFVPIFFAVVLYINCFSGGFQEAQTTWAFKKHFMVIGALNALNGIFIIFANPYVAGVLQTLLSQAAIPFTMALAVVYVGTKFSCWEYLGAFIIFGGLAVEIAPSLSHGGSLSAGTSTTWAAVFLIGQLPSAVGSIYQEMAFREAKCNVIYMMAWSSLAQARPLLLPTNSLLTTLTMVSCTGRSAPTGCSHQLHSPHRRDRRRLFARATKRYDVCGG